jgi:steroid delta-isomerase-like uncharacterized protein
MIFYNSPLTVAGTFVKTNNTMSTIERNKETVRKLYEESLNKGNLGLLPDLFAADFAGPQGEKGPAGFRAFVEPLLKAVPDIHYTIKDLVAEDDKVMINWIWQGTQTGPFRNAPATGKSLTNDGMAVFVLRDGKIVRAETLTDRLGFWQGVGLLPANLATLIGPQKGEVDFIDKFFVPADGIDEFRKRTTINRRFIRTLPGFIADAGYERKDEQGDLICITVARWANMEAVGKAKGAVQAEYQKEGFDPMAMMKRLNITIDRGLYTEFDGQ